MRFLVYHSLPRGSTRADIEKLGESIKNDPQIKGYRSFLNLSESKGVCVFDAPDKTSLVNWLTKNKLVYDSIIEVELEGFRGEWVETPTHVGSGV